MRLNQIVTRIMMKTKGWRKADLVDDAMDFKEAHFAEREWIKRELKKARVL